MTGSASASTKLIRGGVGLSRDTNTRVKEDTMSINRADGTWPAGFAEVLDTTADQLRYREDALHYAQAWGTEAIVLMGFKDERVKAQCCAAIAAHFAGLYLRMRKTRQAS